MEIYGIERHFKLTVGAYREVAAMLPGGNIEELGAALTSDDPFRTMTMIFNLAVVGDLKDEIIRAIVSSQETEIPLKKTEGNATDED